MFAPARYTTPLMSGIFVLSRDPLKQDLSCPPARSPFLGFYPAHRPPPAIKCLPSLPFPSLISAPSSLQSTPKQSFAALLAVASRWCPTSSIMNENTETRRQVWGVREVGWGMGMGRVCSRRGIGFPDATLQNVQCLKSNGTSQQPCSRLLSSFARIKITVNVFGAGLPCEWQNFSCWANVVETPEYLCHYTIQIV